MDVELVGMWSWLLLGCLLMVLIGLALTIWWLVRRRRRDEMRAGFAEELRDCAQRIGLATVWQAPLFQADVFGLRGLIKDFDVRAELWEKTNRDFFRLSVHFPRPLRQEFRLLARRRRGLEHLWKMDAVDVGHREFDDRYNVYCRQGQEERVREILVPSVRRRLMAIDEQVDGVKLGDHCLYIYVDKGIESPVIERLIRDALGVSVEVYNRVVEVGPAKGTAKTSYEMVTVDVLGRESNWDTEALTFPEGSEEGQLIGENRSEREPGRQGQETYPLGSTLPLDESERPAEGEGEGESGTVEESPSASKSSESSGSSTDGSAL